MTNPTITLIQGTYIVTDHNGSEHRLTDRASAYALLYRLRYQAQQEALAKLERETRGQRNTRARRALNR